MSSEPATGACMTRVKPRMPSSEPSISTRFVFVDALRGIACLGVLLHHMLHNSVMELTLRRVLPTALLYVCGYGAFGVQIFFVISGFVLAHSLRNFQPSIAAAGSFILRRQIRLDPAYWTTLVLVLACWGLERSIPSLDTPAFPSVWHILANVVYLQGLLAVPQLVGVAWTLCIEVQFYLVFVALLSLGTLGSTLRRRQILMLTTLGLTGCISLASTFSPGAARWHFTGLGVWFIPYWHYFTLGVFCYYALPRRSRWLWPVSAMLTFDFAIMLFQPYPAAWAAGILTAVALLVVGKTGRLSAWSGGQAIQYFGRISYSLYLVHLTVATAVLRLGYKLTHENRAAALGWFLLAGAASIVAADILHRWVERPSMLLSLRFKTRRKVPSQSVEAPMPAAATIASTT